MKDTNSRIGITTVTCNECAEGLEIDSTDYTEINLILRNEGWTVTNIDGEWVDFCCPACKKKFRGSRKC